MSKFQLYKSDRKLAILIDPDKHSADDLFDFIKKVNEIGPDYILVGGSLIIESSVDEATKLIKSCSNIPTVLFPGHFTQLTDQVDHVLLLSLISGRNPDLLIGQHVLSAPKLKELSKKLIPTGYMLIESGMQTSVSYMSNTTPIPSNKADIAKCTAIAGEALGLKQIYMDAGSGAKHPISIELIDQVSKSIDIPLIVGGGIRQVSHIFDCWESGANLVVIGNGIEENTSLSIELSRLMKEKTS
jgi:phosphoglycerol geranylgeranyltransferase